MKTKFVFLLMLFGLVIGCNFSIAGNDLVWNILGTQIEIGLNQRYISNLSIEDGFKEGLVSDALNIHQDISYWNNYDLIAVLDNAKTELERSKIIDQYISAVSSLSSTSSSLVSYEQSQIDYFKSLSEECESQIDSKNSEFTSAVQSYDYVTAEKVADEIAELRACIARNQVYVKAHSSYASLANALGSLKKKADYLSENKEKIVKYYDILKPDLLKELYNISQTVKVNF